MVRRVFFSFHYENDVWRANVVRNSWVTKPNTETAGFIDAAAFEQVKKGGDGAIKRWIDDQLIGTSVTVVLIGSDTSNREYIQYELEKSWKRGNGIIGIYVHQIRDRLGNISPKGSNTFGPLFTSLYDDKKYFYERFSTYDWVDNNGYSNLGDWVEVAAKAAGK
jgi:hypothetical protein